MTDEAAPAKAKPKPRGRPKKTANREPLRAPLHGPNDDADPLANFEFQPFEEKSALHIDPDIIKGIEQDYEHSLMWVTYECCGKPFPQLVTARKRNGFAEVISLRFRGCSRIATAISISSARL